MKLASFVSLAVAFAVLAMDSCSASSLRRPSGLASADETRELQASSRTARMLSSYDPDMDFLQSEQCEPILKVLNDKIDELLSFGNGAITNYLCNAVERSEAMKVVEKAEEDTENERRRTMMKSGEDAEEGGMDEERSQTHECVLAYERVLANHKDEVGMALGSLRECKEEVAKEIDVIREEKRRHLAECGDHGRCLAFPLIIIPIVIAVVGAAAVGTLAYCAINDC